MLGSDERGDWEKGGCEICCMQLVSAPPPGAFLDTWAPPRAGRRRESQLRELIRYPPSLSPPVRPPRDGTGSESSRVRRLGKTESPEVSVRASSAIPHASPKRALAENPAELNYRQDNGGSERR